MFSEQDPSIKISLENGDGISAYNKMHEILNSVWKECDRVLKVNGFVCINKSLPADKREKCYRNDPHGFDVKTRQETAIEFEQLKKITG